MALALPLLLLAFVRRGDAGDNATCVVLCGAVVLVHMADIGHKVHRGDVSAVYHAGTAFIAPGLALGAVYAYVCAVCVL